MRLGIELPRDPKADPTKCQVITSLSEVSPTQRTAVQIHVCGQPSTDGICPEHVAIEKQEQAMLDSVLKLIDNPGWPLP